MSQNNFSGKVGIQQRVFPKYRAAFFEHLSEACSGGLSLFAGEPRKDESILTTEHIPSGNFVHARNLHFFSGRFYVCFQPGMIRWLNTWDPQALILEANPRYLSNRLAIRWMHQRKRPVIGWGLGAPNSPGPLPEMRMRRRIIYLRSFDALIAYSSTGGEQYIDLGIPQGQVFVAVNSVTPPPSAFIEREPLEHRKVRILFVGRLQKRKLVDNLLHACAAFRKSVELWIVGDGAERSNLEKVADRIFPSAEFKGALQGSALENCYRAADLFVLPGTGGLAVQEAMSYSLPVIVAAGDGTQRDLVTGENGWLIEPGNLEDLKRAMQEAISEPMQLPRRGVASFRVVRSIANVQVMTEVFLQALEYAVGKGK